MHLSSLEASAKQLVLIARQHWAIESIYWKLDRNFLQGNIKRKKVKSAKNLNTIQRMVLVILSIWKGRRRRVTDKGNYS